MKKETERKSNPLPVLASAASLGYYFFLRPQMVKWGTRLGESQRRLPGDEIIPQPNFQLTCAVDIDAPPEAVWPWIAQMGRERTGYYGMDLVNNDGIPSVTFIRKDIAAPEVGMDMDGGYHIMEVEPHRQILFGGFNLNRLPGITVDITALYLLERGRDGSTRLITRARGYTYGSLSIVYNLIHEVLYFMMVQQQFSHIKDQAESMAHLK